MGETAIRRLVHLVDTGAGHVELPAVIDTAGQTLIAAEPERDPATGAELIQQPDLAPRYLERLPVPPPVAARAPARSRVPVTRGDERRNPVAAHHLSHRRSRASSGDQLVFFTGQHAAPSLYVNCDGLADEATRAISASLPMVGQAFGEIPSPAVCAPTMPYRAPSCLTPSWASVADM